MFSLGDVAPIIQLLMWSSQGRSTHRDIAASLRFARIWGSGAFDGQQVGPDHEVADGDIVELHTQ